MFVGHATLAFALVASAAALRGVPRDRAMAMGVAAAGFATVPDVDILYALVGLVQVAPASLGATVEVFWATGNVLHRAVTHSLVLGAPTAAAFGLAAFRRGRPLAAAVLVALVGAVGLVDGPLAAATAGAFAVTGVAVAVVARRRLALSPTAVAVAAAVGLLSHPFGDLFTGRPPAMLYPLDAPLLEARVVLHPDPTMHLLAAFGIELATVWLAAVAYCRLSGIELRPLLDRRAGVGVVYGVAALALPAPTLEVSYHFVFSVLAVGGVGVVGQRPLAGTPDRRRVVLTGLAAVTLAAGSYAVAHVVTSGGLPLAGIPIPLAGPPIPLAGPPIPLASANVPLVG